MQPGEETSGLEGKKWEAAQRDLGVCCSGREAGGAERRVRVRAATECILSVV